VAVLAVPAVLAAVAVGAGAAPAVASSDSTKPLHERVTVGPGRKLYVECRGKGSPTVVLIAGKGNNARDWRQVLDPTDAVRALPTDEVLAGAGTIADSKRAVYPTIARDTRVCSYDRPNTRAEGNDLSTPRAQPHKVDQDVDDLHRVLRKIRAPKPYVLVAHSYGGFIAELYARTYPDDVGGLVMVDAASSYLRPAVTPEKLTVWDRTNRMAAPGQEGVEVADAIAQLDAAPPLPPIPTVVLSADKPLRSDLQPPDADSSVTFDDWVRGQDLLAAGVGAAHVAATDSGHHVYLYSPQLVNAAIREVVADVRDGRGR
jgi:pimeloyl-ACP methyl ester carboxylesterase